MSLPSGHCDSPPCATLQVDTTCRPHAQSDASRQECDRSFCLSTPDRRKCGWCRCLACAQCLITSKTAPFAQNLDHLVVLSAGSKEAAYNASNSWLNWSPRPYVLLDKSAVPNLGLDSSTYLYFILRDYHALPRWLCFLHLHEYHWHHPYYSQLKSMAIDVDVLGERYLSLAHDREGKLVTYDKPPLRELNASEHESLRESLLGLRAPLRPNQHVRFAPGGQFWVARARILARPRSFYAALYDAVTDPRHPQLGEGRSSSIQLYAKRPGLGVFFMEALPPRRPPSLALALSLSRARPIPALPAAGMLTPSQALPLPALASTRRTGM